MIYILKKIHNLLHSNMKLIMRRGSIERDDSILIVSPRRVVADDDSSTCRPGPILNPQTIYTKGSGFTGKLAFASSSGDEED
jgi:hypothetical protein